MYTVTICLSPLVPLVFLCVGDFRIRRIGVGVLSLFAATSLAAGWTWQPEAGIWLRSTALNLVLLALMFCTAALHMRLRYGWQSFLDRALGLGDVLFLAAVTPLFPPREFLGFLIAALLGSLVWWTFYRRRSIPLVGTAGAMLGLFILLKCCLI